MTVFTEADALQLQANLARNQGERKPGKSAGEELSESKWQAEVCKHAHAAGYHLQYHTYDSRRSASGFPDLFLGRLLPRPRLVIAECKTNTGKVTVEQHAWLGFFRSIAALCPGVIAVCVWRPRDRDEVLRVLSGKDE